MIYFIIQQMLQENAELRRKIAVHVVSMAEGGAGKSEDRDSESKVDGQLVIEDVTVFKSIHEMYPLVQPYIDITRKGNKCKL